jgi:diguanylate cyclase (GGDEF)-like protein
MLYDAREGTSFDRGVPRGTFLVDGSGTVLGLDARLEALTGWSAADLVGRRRDFATRLERTPGLVDARGGGRAVLRLRCPGGRTLDVEATVRQAPELGGCFSVQVQRVLACAEGSASAEHDGVDPLTGLPTGDVFVRLLGDRVRLAAEEGRPLAVVLADVDQLRRIGDRFGRDAEREVVGSLGGILRASLRSHDVAARLHEDDFAVLLPGFGRGSARQFAARLRSTVEGFRFLPSAGAEAPRVTLSLGAASLPADAESAGDLLARAREALDEARRLGRNRVWCYTRRPRVPLRTPVFLEGADPVHLGYSKDLSPSGLFVATGSPVEVGMRCALSFPLPSAEGRVHVIGKVVRTVPGAEAAVGGPRPVPGMGFEFERFGPEDRRAIEAFLYENEGTTTRPEDGICSI